MSFYDDLSGLYGGSPTPIDLAELEKLKEILPLIQTELASRYEFIEKIAMGGSGVIIKIRDTNLNVFRALKCARPIPGKEPVFAGILLEEISNLKGISHQNVMTIFFHGSVKHPDEKDCPYYIMEYVEGAKNFLEFLEKYIAEIDERKLLSLLRQLVEGCAHLHKQGKEGMVHLDVKLENALVTPSGRVVLSDLGSARYIDKNDTKAVIIIVSIPWAHPTKILRNGGDYIHRTDDNRGRKSVLRKSLDLSVDLYALGRNILRILDIVAKYISTKVKDDDKSPLSPYARNYLHLLAARLLDGENSMPNELPFGLKQQTFRHKDFKYEELDTVIEDIKKLTGEYSLQNRLPELDKYYPNKIQCSFHNVCAYTPNLMASMNVPVLKRLGEISQLGMMVLIYPAATHTRLEHSLGVYSNTVQYCNALWNDPINPLFRQLTTPRHLRTLLCAAIFHDIGQYGLAHDFEEADKDIFDHTSYTVKVLRGEVDSDIYSPLHDLLQNKWKVDPNEVADLLLGETTDDSEEKATAYKLGVVWRMLHTIIDGPIDADKSDYLIRDSRKLGLSYGEGIDFPRLIDCLTVTFSEETKGLNISIGVTEKGRIAAESMAFSRYALYGAVYWHHTSRSLKCMVHRAIWEALEKKQNAQKYLELPKEFENLILKKLLKLEVEQEQLGLQFEEQTEGQVGKEKLNVPHAPQFSEGDLLMLKWLHNRTTKAGQELILMIFNRDVFKRLLVVSYGKNVKDWKYLTKLRTNIFSKSKSFYSRYQEIYQSELMKEITCDKLAQLKINDQKDNKGAKDKIQSLDSDTIKKLRDKHLSGEILVIIDIPMTKMGSSDPLRYMSEIRDQGKRRLGEAAPLEESIVWKTIYGDFAESIGKIRIFVHPEYLNYFDLMVDDGLKSTGLREATRIFKETLTDVEKSLIKMVNWPLPGE